LVQVLGGGCWTCSLPTSEGTRQPASVENGYGSILNRAWDRERSRRGGAGARAGTGWGGGVFACDHRPSGRAEPGRPPPRRIVCLTTPAAMCFRGPRFGPKCSAPKHPGAGRAATQSYTAPPTVRHSRSGKARYDRPTFLRRVGVFVVDRENTPCFAPEQKGRISVGKKAWSVEEGDEDETARRSRGVDFVWLRSAGATPMFCSPRAPSEHGV